MSRVDISALPPERYSAVLGPTYVDAFNEALRVARDLFAGRTIWNINSTAHGGGVAEMLRSLLAYALGAGVDARWAVITGEPAFFDITKRIHNNLHNFAGDGGPLGEAERAAYEAALAPNAEELKQMIRPKDVVLLHDPQTAGLIPAIKALGVPVIWRCHVGIDYPGEYARRAWDFLRPYVRQSDMHVFSRQSFVWEDLEPEKIQIVMPSIDPFSPKNRDMEPAHARAILHAIGVVRDGGGGQPIYARQDGSMAAVEHDAKVFEDEPAREDDLLVVQVSRWDALKDPLGVISGFAQHVAPHGDYHLVYAGPAVEAVSDDPEGAEVLRSAIALRESLEPAARRRIHLACLPMVDGEENAAMVNALQRRAHVVVQKSLAEGFGLTVAEAMWKGRPVVASRIGGIQDQIEHDRTGILLDDPRDLECYGAAVLTLLRDAPRADAMGEAALERVRDEFLGGRSLVNYADLIRELISS